jgi:hypothetical protein
MTVTTSPQYVEPFDEVVFIEIIAVLEEFLEFLILSVNLFEIIEGKKGLGAFLTALWFGFTGIAVSALVAEFDYQLILFKPMRLSFAHFSLAGCRDRKGLIGGC